MDRQAGAKFSYLKWIVLAAVVIVAVSLFRMVLVRPSFDPDKIARAERRMWQSYYSGKGTELGLELIALFRNQYGLTLFEARKIGELFALSAMRFQSARGNYERVVLPDLTEAYRLIKQVSGRSFDPEAAARAELSWWIARRTPGQDSAKQVGEKIAELYALLYARDHPAFHAAGVLRAEAAALRDSGGANADWARVEDLLRKSYRELQKAI
jgi:hypothetical protein